MIVLLVSLLMGVAGAVPGPVSTPAAPASTPVPRILCERPRTLQLRRFEDRSAQLFCRGQILVRVAVPG